MPHVFAQHELLAPRDDVWRFLAEPHHFSDWWPGVGGVEPDRRGLAPGARWRLFGTGRPTLFRTPEMSGMLIVLEVEPPERIAWHFTGERLDVELRLTEKEPERTLAWLGIRGPWLVGLRRSLPRKALLRLHALCQTAAEL
ncbi:MAG: SRPBCC domain-containing protein [Gaiellaceae bacterium]